MKFSKLLLASAIAMSSSAFAMESMTDESLSEATGQDGINVKFTTLPAGISFVANIYDTDAFATPVNIGALTLGTAVNPVKLITTASGINLAIDAGSAAAGASPVLNIAVGIGAGTIIHTGDIGVAGTATAKGTGGTFPALVNNGVILNNMIMTLGATTMTVQLGAGATNFLNIASTMTGGLDITNFALNDLSPTNGGSIFAASIAIDDAGAGTDLTIAATAGIKTGAVGVGGLSLALNTVGTGGMDVRITDFGLGQSGTTPIMGDISLVGLNLNGSTLLISGK